MTMSDDRSPGERGSPPRPAMPADSGKECRKCGCNLTYVPEPVICPQCGTMYRDAQAGSPLGKASLGGRLIFLNATALLLALFFLFPPKSRGFGWFPFSGVACLGVCIVIPLQVCVPFWALYEYLRRDSAAPESRWLIYAVITPFVLALVSLLAVLSRQ